MDEIKKMNSGILTSLFKCYSKEINANTNLYKAKSSKCINLFNNESFIHENDFNKKIFLKLEKIKLNTIEKMNNIFDKYSQNFFFFFKNIEKFIIGKDLELAGILENNLEDNENFFEYAENVIFDKMNTLIELHEKIIVNIEDNFKLLNKFLIQKELIFVKYPIKYFFKSNIDYINSCSFIYKFNQNINIKEFIKNGLYDEEDLLVDKKNYQKKMDILNNNYAFIKGLTIHGFDCNAICQDIIPVINSKSNLEKLLIQKYNGKKDVNLIKFGNLEKIKHFALKTGDYFNRNFVTNLLTSFNPENLISLSLENINMNNLGLSILFDIFSDNQKYFNFLEYLSLARNYISRIKPIFNMKKNLDKCFKNLKQINLYKNNIYSFEIPLGNLPKINFIDFSSNSILTGAFMNQYIKKKDKLFLFSDNIFISNNKNNNETYIKYLEKLKDYNYSLKTLHLNFIFNSENSYLLKNIKLSLMIRISLKKLDLSYCGLITHDIIQFLRNNNGLFSLQSLNLKYNLIEIDIFEEILSNQIKLESLKSINLTENPIFFDCYEKCIGLINFVESYQNFKKLKLKGNSKFFYSYEMNSTLGPDNYKVLLNEFKNNLKCNNRFFVIKIGPKDIVFYNNA